MNIFKFTTKLIAQILFVIIFFSTLDAKNLDKFDEESHISDYFSGILLLNDNQYNESYKFLKKLEGLEESHDHYSSKYLFSLVNLGKFNEAFSYSKKLEKREKKFLALDELDGLDLNFWTNDSYWSDELQKLGFAAVEPWDGSIKFKTNKAVFTDYNNGSASDPLTYGIYGSHDGKSTYIANLVGATIDKDNIKKVIAKLKQRKTLRFRKISAIAAAINN